MTLKSEGKGSIELKDHGKPFLWLESYQKKQKITGCCCKVPGTARENFTLSPEEDKLYFIPIYSEKNKIFREGEPSLSDWGQQGKPPHAGWHCYGKVKQYVGTFPCASSWKNLHHSLVTATAECCKLPPSSFWPFSGMQSIFSSLTGPSPCCSTGFWLSGSWSRNLQTSVLCLGFCSRNLTAKESVLDSLYLSQCAALSEAPSSCPAP